ncbi:MAG: PorP/SprF family type IX secretion system membrane protein [Bacteroidales bacterium]|nr:PorP/SprF family type IX secretion system membrane protein [Bacteroidales bacterium]
MKKTCSGAVILLFVLNGVFSQEPYFSQFYNAPVFYNPANVGFYKGFKARIKYRNQWPQYFDDIKNYLFTMDFAEHNLPGVGGAGLVFNSNREGTGFIKRTLFGLAASSRIKIGKTLTTQLGLMGSLVQKQIDYEQYIFSDQLDHRHGLIYPQSSFEPGSDNKVTYPDLTLGWMGNYMEENTSFTVGLAVHHVLKPDESFLGLGSYVPRRWIAHTDLIFVQRRNPRKGFKFNPAIQYEYQAGFNTFCIGLNMSKSALYTGVWYRNKQSNFIDYQALILMGGVKIPMVDEDSRLILTYSYDIGLSGMKATGGAHEISINFEFDRINIFKSKSYFANDYPMLEKTMRF